ncbi:unnamed protein product [Lathyrus sativus]|nr:unnamed protein product [Lathyrus sativus]
MATTPPNPAKHESARLKSLAQTKNSKTALKYAAHSAPQSQGISELVNSQHSNRSRFLRCSRR